MRIALASIHPRPLSGQIEGLVGLAEALRGRGHSVSVVSAFANDRLFGPNRIRLAIKPQRIFLDQPSRIGRILMGLIRLAPQVDLIQLNLPTPAFSMFADLLQVCVRVPVLAGYEAHLAEWHELARRDWIRQSPSFYLPRLIVNNPFVARLTLRAAAGYLVNSRYQLRELTRLGVRPDRVFVLPPVLPHDKRGIGEGAMRAQLPPGRIVTYIGHSNHVKGVDILGRAFQILAPRLPEARLVIAWSGVGSDRVVESLAADPALQDRVFTLGRISVRELLAASDVVALPYRMTIGQAAFPAVLAEAMQARVPVVTTDLPLLNELTHNGETAILVAPEDAAALAEGLERVLTRPAEAERLRQAQRRWSECMEPDHVAEEYEQLYQQLTARQTGLLRST